MENPDNEEFPIHSLCIKPVPPLVQWWICMFILQSKILWIMTNIILCLVLAIITFSCHLAETAPPVTCKSNKDCEDRKQVCSEAGVCRSCDQVCGLFASCRRTGSKGFKASIHLTFLTSLLNEQRDSAQECWKTSCWSDSTFRIQKSNLCLDVKNENGRFKCFCPSGSNGDPNDFWDEVDPAELSDILIDSTSTGVRISRKVRNQFDTNHF